MNKKILICFLSFLLFIISGGYVIMSMHTNANANTNTVDLPSVDITDGMPINSVIKQRRSVRKFVRNKNLTQKQLAQLLWAAQGITSSNKQFRAAPSAGALYPLELYVVKSDGVWLYDPSSNSIREILSKDLREQLVQASMNQMFIKDAAAVIVIAGVYERITKKYGDRGINYVYVEAGGAMQNILLEAVNLGLASVPIAGFYDKQVKKLLRLPRNQAPLLIVPVGYGETDKAS